MLYALAALFLGLAHAATPAPSEAMAQLQQEAEKNPAASTTPEGAKNAASQGFSGDAQAPQAPLPTGKDADGQSYVMTGQQVIPGINIYTPRLDPTGKAVTEKPKPVDLIGKKKILGAAALGIAALAGGAMLGGPFGAALLAAGGAFLGIAALLGFMRHKLNGGGGKHSSENHVAAASRPRRPID